jgi:tRNA-specific 2-thiouridylase
VSAALLLQQGYEVVGGFMKNYVSDKGNCTTYKDAEEAIKVANHLGIELISFDLQKEYQEKIIDYIFAGYEKGITPNPDVLCNNLIKFDVFLQKALELGFDKIATGHYAKIVPFITPLSGGEGGAKTTRYEEVMSDGRGGCYTLQR